MHTHRAYFKLGLGTPSFMRSCTFTTVCLDALSSLNLAGGLGDFTRMGFV